MQIASLYSVAIAIFFSFVLRLLAFRFRSKSNTDINLPPGSYGWPFIGETLEFFFGKPEKFVRDRMKKYSPDIFKTKILGEKTVVICGPNGHKFLFSNEQTYFTAFRPEPTKRLFRSYQTKAPAEMDTEHQESKAFRQPGFFKPESLARFIGNMESISADLIASHWDGKDEVNVYPLAKTVTLTIACKFFLGTDNPERISRLVNHFDNITLGMHSINWNFPGTIFYRANRSAAAVRKELQSVVREKMDEIPTGAPAKDLLSHMIVTLTPTGKPMSENEIADRMMGLIVAGYSTVATTITFWMKNVGERSDIYNKIRTEQMNIAANKKGGELLKWEDTQKMKYSWNVICETMRLIPPIQGTYRQVVREFTYGGYTIPKGWKVYWTVSSTNMNPIYFKKPEIFDPCRYNEGEYLVPYTYVPFGGGARLCPGKEYARLLILSFVHNVVKKYKWEVLFSDEKVKGEMMPIPEKGLLIRLHRL